MNITIDRLKKSYLFEVEVRDGKIIKYVVRLSFDDRRDISIAFMPKGKTLFVKTMWLNMKSDIHRTLKHDNYTSDIKSLIKRRG